MQLRRLYCEDFGELLRIWNAGAHHDPLTRALLREKMRDDPDVDPARCVVAELDGAVAGFAVPVLRAFPEPRRGFIKLLAVDPSLWRQGIGRALLAAAEDVLREHGATSVRLLESAPNYLVPGIDSRYRGACEFVTACGYVPVGETANLSVDLGALETLAPDARAVNGIEVRRAVEGEQPAALAFVRHHWPAWEGEMMAAFANTPATLYLAWRADEVVGFSAYDANNRDTAWFGPMGVAPEARQGGIGGILLRCCLEDLRDQGHGEATIPWVGPAEFYANCVGARPAREFLRFEKTL